MTQSDNVTPHKASEYDKDVRNTIPFYDCFLEETVDLVRTVKPEVEIWLDTGCGTGTLVTKAFPHFSYTIFVLSDPSANMLNQARQSLSAIPQSRIQFLDPVGTENLPINNICQPQVITAIQSHHYLDINTRRTATQICYDLLARDGVFVTFENIRPESERGIDVGLDRWKRYQSSKGKGEEAVEAHKKRFGTAYLPITIAQHLELLKKCGFVTSELFWYSHLQAGFYAIK